MNLTCSLIFDSFSLLIKMNNLKSLFIKRWQFTILRDFSWTRRTNHSSFKKILRIDLQLISCFIKPKIITMLISSMIWLTSIYMLKNLTQVRNIGFQTWTETQWVRLSIRISFNKMMRTNTSINLWCSFLISGPQSNSSMLMLLIKIKHCMNKVLTDSPS